MKVEESAWSDHNYQCECEKCIPVDKASDHTGITTDEVSGWCEGTISDYTLERLTEILNGSYSLDDARNDILSFRSPTGS